MWTLIALGVIVLLIVLDAAHERFIEWSLRSYFTRPGDRSDDDDA